MHRQRGYLDGYHERDTSANEAAAGRVSPEALQAYREGLRVGRRERGRRR